MEDNNPHFEVRRNEFSSNVRRDDRQAFLAKMDRGRGVAEARDKGFELVDAVRLQQLFADLDRLGFITVHDSEAEPDAQMAHEKAMEILRG